MVVHIAGGAGAGAGAGAVAGAVAAHGDSIHWCQKVREILGQRHVRR